jgi:capsular exopolysaccharide synthesis family protein
MAKEKKRSIVDFFRFDSVAGTELRRLLHNVSRPIRGVAPRSILVTSALTGEGKSTIAAMLAMTSAHHKKRNTLLIDSDLRRPVVHKMFNVENTIGFANLLTNEADFDDAIKATAIPNLWLLPIGSAENNPIEVFREDTIRKVIERAVFRFDSVFVDCAPIIPVSDPAIMSTAVDGVVLIIKAGSTQREIIERAIEIIKKAEANVLGLVLNNVEGALPYHYGSEYYGQYYGHKR